tara:strand:- start:593 stop:1000 length:408 start_codon:yes stop_codon:yes gene_type:complete
MNKVRGYNFSRSFMGERVPQHVQNIVIKDFCQKRNFNFLLSVSEYSMPNSFYILKDLLNNLTGLYGVVAYSIFQMPYDDKERKLVFKKILNKKKKIFFACENLEVSNNNDVDRVESIWLVKKASLKKEKDKLNNE